MSGCIMPLSPHLGSADLWTKDSFEHDKNEELFLPEKKMLRNLQMASGLRGYVRFILGFCSHRAQI